MQYMYLCANDHVLCVLGRKQNFTGRIDPHFYAQLGGSINGATPKTDGILQGNILHKNG